MAEAKELTEEELWATLGKKEKTIHDTKSFPKAFKKYQLIWESFSMIMEEPYFWIYNAFTDSPGGLKGGWKFKKIQDVYAATEHSSYYGDTQSKLGMVQDRITNSLRSIGAMIKELSQLVHSIRVIDERLKLYDAYLENNSESADISLKDYFIKYAEGGAEQPSSVYGIANKLKFTTLPVMFFKTTIPFDKLNKIDEIVENKWGEINNEAKRMLQSKLAVYYAWFETTHREHLTRRNLQLKYMYQVYNVVKTNMNWIRPYMRYARKLNMDFNRLDRADLVSAFEQSMIEIEYIAYQMNKDNKEVYDTIIVNFLYRTRPEMSFQKDYRHKGPAHLGRVNISLRSYGWTMEQIENYEKIRQLEDIKIFGDILESETGTKNAFDSIVKDVQKYIDEAEEMFTGKKKKEPKIVDKDEGKTFWQIYKEKKKKAPSHTQGMLEPFLLPFKSFKFLIPKREEKAPNLKEEIKRSQKSATGQIWNMYKYFKKSHKMLAW